MMAITITNPSQCQKLPKKNSTYAMAYSFTL